MKPTRGHPPSPYRGRFGAARPARLESLALPPAPMPSHDRGRPLKSWRYIGVFCDELMLCAASVRIGPARQCFWAIWDRRRQQLHERTALGTGAVAMSAGRLTIRDRTVQVDLELAEDAGIETVCASGDSYGWTRKQAIRGHRQGDDRRRGRWRCRRRRSSTTPPPTTSATRAGAGAPASAQTRAARRSPGTSCRASTIPRKTASGRSGSTVSRARHRRSRSPTTCRPSEALRFAAEATRERRENLLLVRSRYRQPFGTFSGVVPGTTAVLAHGLGVMEDHDVHW